MKSSSVFCQNVGPVGVVAPRRVIMLSSYELADQSKSSTSRQVRQSGITQMLEFAVFDGRLAMMTELMPSVMNRLVL